MPRIEELKPLFIKRFQPIIFVEDWFDKSERQIQLLQDFISDLKNNSDEMIRQSICITELRILQSYAWTPEHLVPLEDYDFIAPDYSSLMCQGSDLTSAIDNLNERLSLKDLFKDQFLYLPFIIILINEPTVWNDNADAINRLKQNFWFKIAVEENHVIVFNSGDAQSIMLTKSLLGCEGIPSDLTLQFTLCDFNVKTFVQLEKICYKQFQS